MRQRRFAQATTSDDEDNAPPPPPPRTRSAGDASLTGRKRKLVRFQEEHQKERMTTIERKKKVMKSDEIETEAATENVDQGDVEPQPMGTVVRVSGKGKGRRTHYESFEYNGLQYWLEDPALFNPENRNQKPYVAIIKDIARTWHGDLRVTGQWFYRPEEAKTRGGGNLELHDTRELFYSFHRDEVPAESVFHKCVVHFIPLNKQIPPRQKHPGFFVQQVYDTELRMLFQLTDKDYEESKQYEIDLLVQKTLARLGGLPDLVPECKDEDQMKNKRVPRRRNMLPPMDVSRESEGLVRSQSLKLECPGNGAACSSEYHAILSKFKLLTEETQRDKWLEILLRSVHFMCTPVGNKQNGGSNIESHDKSSNDGASFDWPDAAISAVVSLEKAAHELLSSDFHKYNQKMRQLAFNLKSNAALARRLLSRELGPAQILNMSPIELKEGLTAEEIADQQPEESGHLQMTDARCTRCKEKQVGLIDIIQAGHGDRYQLECVACGNIWYASRDDAATLSIEGPSLTRTADSAPSRDDDATLSIEGPSLTRTADSAPLATAKFGDVEKGLVSPNGAENAIVSALSRGKSFNKPCADQKLKSATRYA